MALTIQVTPEKRFKIWRFYGGRSHPTHSTLGSGHGVVSHQAAVDYYIERGWVQEGDVVVVADLMSPDVYSARAYRIRKEPQPPTPPLSAVPLGS